MEQIVGSVEKISFQNPESGFTVAFIKIKQRREPVCAVGMMPFVQPGETVFCHGNWKNHLIYGQQFEVSQIESRKPSDIVGITKYLSSGLVKGIGPVYAGRIVDKFGVDTLNIIDQEVDRLLEVEGIGSKRLEIIKSCWTSQRAIRDVMVFLQGQGISPSFAQKIYKAYGPESIQKVQQNPYCLARDIPGIGFKSADKIAEQMKIPKESPHRVDAGIEFFLHQMSDFGHVCFPVVEFCIEMQKQLEVPFDLISERIKAIKRENRIEVLDLMRHGQPQEFMWMRALYVSEVGIARELLRLHKSKSSLRPIDAIQAILWVEKKLNMQLAENQKQAVIQSTSNKTHIITGGPGTGKSTITKAILAITSKLTDKIVLAAPTGRAAKRMSEITGREARTIHSLLAYSFQQGKFTYNRENPLDCDLMIVDEASMIDTYLMYHLLRAVPDHARIIFVGDINQLPSVGPGNVLKDMIQSNQIPVTLLNEIFRQAAGSQIVSNAHRINKGILPEIHFHKESDFFFIDAEEPTKVLQEILLLVAERLPRKYQFNPIEDIQVLAPMKKGVIGTINLNVALQEKLNPVVGKDNPLLFRGNRFFIGDKVMQIRNNYKRNVFNGDIGKITAIDFEEEMLTVNMDGQEVLYPFSDLDEITLSYAVSIHKYQGSECPCVVIPLHTTHFKLLTRNLLYTGVTRGKKLVVLVGNKKALVIAVKNDDVQLRYTGLQQAISRQG